MHNGSTFRTDVVILPLKPIRSPSTLIGIVTKGHHWHDQVARSLDLILCSGQTCHLLEILHIDDVSPFKIVTSPCGFTVQTTRIHHVGGSHHPMFPSQTIIGKTDVHLPSSVLSMAIMPGFGFTPSGAKRVTRLLLGTPLVRYLLKMLRFGLTTPTHVWMHGLVNTCKIGLLCGASWLSPPRPRLMHQHHMSTHPPSLRNLWITTVRPIRPQWLVHIHKCHRSPTQRHHVLVQLHVSIPAPHLSRLLRCVHSPR